MKTIVISVAVAFTLGGAAAAWADPPSETVQVPTDLSSASQARAYTNALRDAIDRECRLANNPVIGFNEVHYEGCRESERAQIAATEPTGLFAARLGVTRKEAQSRYAQLQTDEDIHG
jgi:hypothetical protein